MRRADEMHERVARLRNARHARRVERVARDGGDVLRQAVRRARTHERPDCVPARGQRRNEPRSDVSGTAGDEDVHRSAHDTWSNSIVSGVALGSVGATA